MVRHLGRLHGSICPVRTNADQLLVHLEAIRRGQEHAVRLGSLLLTRSESPRRRLRAALNSQVKLGLLLLLDADKLARVLAWVGAVSWVKPRVEESVFVGSKGSQLDALLLLLCALLFVKISRFQ